MSIPARDRMPDAAAMDAIAAILPEIDRSGVQAPLRRRVAAIVAATGRTVVGDQDQDQESWPEPPCGYSWPFLSGPLPEGQHTCRLESQHTEPHECACGMTTEPL